jgi:hypothetical protein
MILQEYIFTIVDSWSRQAEERDLEKRVTFSKIPSEFPMVIFQQTRKRDMGKGTIVYKSW